MSVTSDRSVVFSGYSGFLYQQNWPLRYNWNIVESGIKHHETKPIIIYMFILLSEGVMRVKYGFQ
jgi:hypothetical protein